MEFVSPEGLRIDGRRPRELRRLGAQLDVLQSADGSAIFEMGNTKVCVHAAPCHLHGGSSLQDVCQPRTFAAGT